MNFEIPIPISEIKEEAIPSVRELTTDEAVIWMVSTDHFDCLYTCYRAVLSNEEMNRAERFRQSVDAQRFLTGAIALRLLVSAYLNVDAADIQFQRGRYGKPSLLGDLPPIHFNLSHSGKIVLIAFSLTPIGIDIEEMNAAFNFTSLLDNVFNEEEKSYLHQDLKNTTRRFYLLWTRKECVAKQNGMGIHETMNTYSVIAQKTKNTGYEISKEKETLKISSFLLPMHPEYIASICYNQKITSIRYQRFTLSAFKTNT